MKTNFLKQASVFFFSIAISSSAFADDNFGDKKGSETSMSFFTTVTENKAIIKINNISAEKGASLKVFSSDGSLVYLENIMGMENYDRKYDFTQLKPGKYSMVLISGGNELVKKFSVGFDGVVTMFKEANFADFRPIVFEKENKVNVCFENRTNRKLRVSVINRQGKEVYGEWVEEDASYGRSLDLSKVGKGEYTVEVYTLGSEYDYAEAVSVI